MLRNHLQFLSTLADNLETIDNNEDSLHLLIKDNSSDEGSNLVLEQMEPSNPLKDGKRLDFKKQDLPKNQALEKQIVAINNLIKLVNDDENKILFQNLKLNQINIKLYAKKPTETDKEYILRLMSESKKVFQTAEQFAILSSKISKYFRSAEEGESQATYLEKIRSEQNNNNNQQNNNQQSKNLTSSTRQQQLTQRQQELDRGFIKNCANLIANLKKIQTRYEELSLEIEKKVKQCITDLDPIESNTVTLFVWYVEGDVPGRRKIMGIDSTGHSALGVRHVTYKPGTQEIETDVTKYVSFYPKKDGSRPQSNLLNSVPKKIGLPSVNNLDGILTPYAEDMARNQFEKGKGSYWRYEKIVIPCQQSKTLNTQAIIDEIDKLEKSERGLNYNFYNSNCSTMVMDLLKVGGCEKFVRLPIATERITSPQQLIEYASTLRNHFKDNELEKELANNETYKGQVIKRLILVKSKFEEWQQSRAATLAPKDKENDAISNFIKDAINELDALIVQINNKQTIESILAQLTKYEQGAYNQIVNDEKNLNLGSKISAIYQILTPVMPSNQLSNLNSVLQRLCKEIENNTVSLKKQLVDAKDKFVSIIENVSIVEHDLESIRRMIKDESTNIRMKTTIILKKLDEMESHLGAGFQLIEEITANESIEKNKSASTDMMAEFEKIKQLYQSSIISLYEARSAFHHNHYFTPFMSTTLNSNNLIDKLSIALGIKSKLEGKNSETYHSSSKDESDTNQVQGLPNGPNCPLVEAGLKHIQLDFKHLDLKNNLQALMSYNYWNSISEVSNRVQSKLSRTLWIPTRNRYKEFNCRSQFLLAVNAFYEGKLSTTEYLKELKRISRLSPRQETQQKIENYLKSFEIQFHLSVIEMNSDILGVRKTYSTYNYLQTTDNRFIHRNHPTIFLERLPQGTTRADIIESNNKLIAKCIEPLLGESYFTAVMPNFPNSLFRRAVFESRDKNSTTNAFSHLQRKSNTLSANKYRTEPEEVFVILFSGIKLIHQIHQHKLTYQEALNGLALFEKSIQDVIATNNHFSNYLLNFCDVIRSSVNTFYFDSEIFPADIQEIKRAFHSEANDVLCDYYINQYKASISPNSTIYDMHHEIKDKLTLKEFKNNKTYHALFKVTNKQLYFSTTGIKRHLGLFLNVKNADAKSIEQILVEGSLQIDFEKESYKNDLISMIKNFVVNLNSEMNEEQFYHQLLTYIDVYKNKYDIKHITEIKNAFLKRYSNLEYQAKRNKKEKQRNSVEIISNRDQLHFEDNNKSDKDLKTNETKEAKNETQEPNEARLIIADGVEKNANVIDVDRLAFVKDNNKQTLIAKAATKLSKLQNKKAKTHYFFGLFKRSNESVVKEEIKIRLKKYHYQKLLQLTR